MGPIISIISFIYNFFRILSSMSPIILTVIFLFSYIHSFVHGHHHFSCFISKPLLFNQDIINSMYIFIRVMYMSYRLIYFTSRLTSRSSSLTLCKHLVSCFSISLYLHILLQIYKISL